MRMSWLSVETKGEWVGCWLRQDEGGLVVWQGKRREV